MKTLPTIEPLDIDRLSEAQKGMALAMMNAHVIAQYTRTQMYIAMIRDRLGDDALGCKSIAEWCANEDRDLAALQRALAKLPDTPAPERGETLN